jgi:hypothetical protein
MSTFKNATTAILFKGGTYEGSVKGELITFPDVELKTALISVAQAKQIVRTQIQGRDGTVKEYVGMDDYSISVSGTITSDNGIEPIDEVIDLKQLLDAPIPLDIICPFLNRMGIQYAVVESYELPQQAGGISYQTFNINLISDIPTEIRISNA